MSGTQLTVSHGGPSGETVLLDLPEDSEIGEQEKTTTAAAFLGCVSESARRDDRLDEDQSRSLQIEPTSGNKDVRDAVMIGKKVMEFGDEIEALRMKIRQDSDFQEFVDHAVADSDGRRASLTAFEEFTAIANQVLEVDDTGVAAGISYGRIASLFLMGYELCAGFVRRHGASLFLKFIGRILDFLIRFLKNIGFFQWLSKHGWHRLLTANTYLHGLSHGVVVGAVATGVVAVVAVGFIWYFRR